jgi:undecaprenyl-diphosphatase
MTAWVVSVAAGLIQGVVEWLPVSSKTMITFVFAAGGYSFGTGYVMGLLANFGSFFAALWYFRTDIIEAIRGLRHPLSGERDAQTLRYLFLATLATGAIGLPIYLGVTTAFTVTSGAYIMVGIGVLLLVTSWISVQRERLVREVASAGPSSDDPAKGPIPGSWAALIVGACQGLAALPGISRSAVTVTPLLWTGQRPSRALRLSFLLDVLALIAAGAVPLVIGHHGLAAVARVGTAPTLLMIVVSAIASFFTIDVILRFASRLRASVITALIGGLTIVAAIVLHIH